MAIQTRIVNGSITEIYVGGGNWLTQSAPTNFHQFYKQKMLTPGESIDDFKEVTEAEKKALEKSDAEWVAPSEELIARWNSDWTIGFRSYGKYNRETGFFEGNDVLNITTEQALKILEFGVTSTFPSGPNPYRYSQWLPTVLPIIGGIVTNIQDALTCVNVSVIRILDYYIVHNKDNPSVRKIGISNSQGFNGYNWSLREVKGLLNMSNDMSHKTHFYNCKLKALKIIWLCNIVKDINFSQSYNLETDCIAYMVDNAANTSAITITLHPDAYERVTDDIFAKAAEKNITIASA